MAEITDIIIKGIDKSLPRWATDATLREVEDEIKKLVAILSKKKDMMSVSSKKSQDNMDSFAEGLKDLEKEQKKHQFNLKKFSSKVADSAENTTDAIEKIRVAGYGGYASISALTNVGQGLTSIFKSMTTPAGLLGGLFVGITEGTSLFINYLKNSADMLLTLYDNGLTFQNGLGDLRMAAGDAAMPLNDFAKMLVKHSATVKALGVTSFGQVLKETRNLAKEQNYYGMTITEINEYTSSYLDTIRRQGFLERLNDKQKADASNNYIKQLTTFSQIMGKSREQIAAQIESSAKDPRIQAIARTLGPGAKAFLDTLTSAVGPLASIDGEAAKQVTNDFITAIGTQEGALTSTFEGLMAAGRGDLANEFLNLSRAVRDNSISQEEAQSRSSRLLEGIKDLSPADFKALQASMITSKAAFYNQAQLISSISADMQEADFKRKNAKPIDPVAGSWITLKNTVDEIIGKFQNVFAFFFLENKDIFEKITVNIADFAIYLGQKLEGVLNWIAELIDPATRDKAVADLKDGIKSLVEVMMSAIGTAIADGISKIPSMFGDSILSGNIGTIAATIGGVGLAFGGLIPVAGSIVTALTALAPAIASLFPVIAAITGGVAAGVYGGHVVGNALSKAIYDVDLSPSETTEVENGAVVGSATWKKNKMLQHNVLDLANQKGGTDILMSPATRSNNEALEALQKNADIVATQNPELVDYVKRLDALIKLQEEANDLAKQGISLNEDQKKALETANNNAKYPAGVIR